MELQGHPRAVNALAKLYSRLIGRQINPMTEVLITAGAYESLFCAVMSNVGKNDEVHKWCLNMNQQKHTNVLLAFTS